MDYELLEDLRAGRGPLSAERLVTAFKTAHKPVDQLHRQATQIWRAPLSLFEPKSLEVAPPQWAVDVALEGQRIVDEAVEVNDLREAYETQIKLAREEGRGVASEPVAKLLVRIHSLHQKFTDLLPRLRDARSCIDNPAEYAAKQPPTTTTPVQERATWEHRVNIMAPKPKPPSPLTQALKDMEASVGAVLGGLGVLIPKRRPSTSKSVSSPKTNVPEVMPIPGDESFQTSQPSSAGQSQIEDGDKDKSVEEDTDKSVEEPPEDNKDAAGNAQEDAAGSMKEVPEDSKDAAGSSDVNES